LGHPRATQAPRKGRPRVELDKCFVCNKSRKMRGGAPLKIAEIAKIG
jgi:hypothetical protein